MDLALQLSSSTEQKVDLLHLRAGAFKDLLQLDEAEKVIKILEERGCTRTCNVMPVACENSDKALYLLYPIERSVWRML